MADEEDTRPGNGGRDPDAEAGAPAAEAHLAELRAELAAIKDRWLRERAELENYKRRMTREKSEALRFGSESLLKDLIPVIDNLHRALDHARGSREVEPIVTGIELVLRGFDEVLERHGVRVVEAHGTPFDPNRHEAVGHVESDAPPNTVIAEHQRGYVLHDRLLRPAMVTVGKARPAADVASEPDDD